ncbi:restriction endonuclease subunit S, partial [Hydrogenobacter sp. Uz 6-8]|uniref:restriction endonuclease subunit S n=1 Tax=Hydrogenobacter sp. Uz 6-8 TaxID=3384828 RepID=UPI0038FCFA68
MEGTTGRRRLSKNVLYNLLFPLPPLEEQKAIADVLRAVQEVIEKTEKVIRATKELKKSMMKQLFTYGVYKDTSGNWKIGNPETVEVKETEIGLIPKHWEVVRLEKVLFEIDKRVYQLNQTNSSDLPVLSLTKNDGLILQSQRFEKRVATEDTSKYKVVHKNHIVYNPYVIWEGAIHILEKFDIGIVSPVYVVLQVIDNMAIPEYVDAWLRTATALMLYSRLASGTVNRRRAIKKRDFLQIAFPLPPLEEQKQIAQILQAIDQKIEKEENYKKALKNLFKSLLHSLMNGKIRVRRV